MAAATPRPSTPRSGRSRPIILLELATLASDDRFFNGWERHFGLLPLQDEAGSRDALQAEG